MELEKQSIEQNYKTWNIDYKTKPRLHYPDTMFLHFLHRYALKDKPKAWMNNLQIFDKNSYPVYVPSWRVQDVDTPEDWRRAELIFQIVDEENQNFTR